MRPGLLNGKADSTEASAGRFRILYFGRLDIWMKGLDLLIEAIGGEPTLRDAVDVILLGSGTSREKEQLLNLAAQHGIGERLRVQEYSDQPWQAVRNANLVVLPSRFDGFAQTVAESLALGVPVLVSSRAAPSEYLGREVGVVVVDPTVQSIRRGLVEAMRSHDQLRIAAENSDSYLRSTLTWAVIAKQWEDQFRRMGVMS
jgi:glycosyltransferase involved in cell wall biosynthesis